MKIKGYRRSQCRHHRRPRRCQGYHRHHHRHHGRPECHHCRHRRRQHQRGRRHRSRRHLGEINFLKEVVLMLLQLTSSAWRHIIHAI